MYLVTAAERADLADRYERELANASVSGEVIDAAHRRAAQTLGVADVTFDQVTGAYFDALDDLAVDLVTIVHVIVTVTDAAATAAHLEG